MEKFTRLFITYFFLLLIALGLAFAIALSFPVAEKYAYSFFIAVHSVGMFILFILVMSQPEPIQAGEDK